MAIRRREISAFSLSFLDVLSIGLGAVVFLSLIFAAYQKKRSQVIEKSQTLLIQCNTPGARIGAFVKLSKGPRRVSYAPPFERDSDSSLESAVEWRRLEGETLMLLYNRKKLRDTVDLGIFLQDPGEHPLPEQIEVRVYPGLPGARRLKLTRSGGYSQIQRSVRLP